MVCGNVCGIVCCGKIISLSSNYKPLETKRNVKKIIRYA